MHNFSAFFRKSPAVIGVFFFLIFTSLAATAAAATYSVQDAGSGAGCPNAWPPSIVGNYVENGTLNGAPRYDGSGWYIYRVNIWGAANWVVSNTLGSADYNNSTIAFYQVNSAATPPTGTGYSNTKRTVRRALPPAR